MELGITTLAAKKLVRAAGYRVPYKPFALCDSVYQAPNV